MSQLTTKDQLSQVRLWSEHFGIFTKTSLGLVAPKIGEKTRPDQTRPDLKTLVKAVRTDPAEPAMK